jgi:hypothetical protein
MLIGYARVSTVDQNLALQRDALTEAGCTKIFTEQMVSIAILNHLADSRLVVFNNCGHWPPSNGPRKSSPSSRTIERDR